MAAENPKFRYFGLVILSLACLAAFLAIANYAFSDNSALFRIDSWLSRFVALNVSETCVNIALWISDLGSIEAVLIAGAVISLGLVLSRRVKDACIILVPVVSTGAALALLKFSFLRPRPDGLDIIEYFLGDPSFPSGHSGMAAAFFFAAGYSVFYSLGRGAKWRKLAVVIICAAIILAVGVSRIVLNVHWASDVLAGWTLGIFIATTTIFVVERAFRLRSMSGYDEANGGLGFGSGSRNKGFTNHRFWSF